MPTFQSRFEIGDEVYEVRKEMVYHTAPCRMCLGTKVARVLIGQIFGDVWKTKIGECPACGGWGRQWDEPTDGDKWLVQGPYTISSTQTTRERKSLNTRGDNQGPIESITYHQFCGGRGTWTPEKSLSATLEEALTHAALLNYGLPQTISEPEAD